MTTAESAPERPDEPASVRRLRAAVQRLDSSPRDEIASAPERRAESPGSGVAAPLPTETTDLLRQTFRSPESRDILRGATTITGGGIRDWHAGGCRIAAEGILRWSGKPASLVGVVLNTPAGEQTEHVAVKVAEDRYLDSMGEWSGEGLLTAWRANAASRFRASARLVDFPVDTPESIDVPPRNTSRSRKVGQMLERSAPRAR